MNEVPYIVHEGDMARLERANRRLWILSIMLVCLLVGTNAGWVWYESQFQDEVMTITQENEEGYNNFIGNDGDIINGEANNHT